MDLGASIIFVVSVFCECGYPLDHIDSEFANFDSSFFLSSEFVFDIWFDVSCSVLSGSAISTLPFLSVTLRFSVADTFPFFDFYTITTSFGGVNGSTESILPWFSSENYWVTGGGSFLDSSVCGNSSGSSLPSWDISD